MNAGRAHGLSFRRLNGAGEPYLGPGPVFNTLDVPKAIFGLDDLSARR
jgi:hypothetical protein